MELPDSMNDIDEPVNSAEGMEDRGTMDPNPFTHEFAPCQFQRLGLVAGLPAAIAAHEEYPPWGLMQNIEGCFQLNAHSPSHVGDTDSDEVSLSIRHSGSEGDDESSSDEIDVVMVSRPGSALSAVGDSNGSPSSSSPPPDTPSPTIPDRPNSSDSTMGPSDCENHPVSPCHSPYYSRPGSPWPLYARPSFKKTRSPFWTTFRVRDFR